MQILRIETKSKAIIHCSDDNWKNVHDLKVSRQILEIYFADLPTKSPPEENKSNSRSIGLRLIVGKEQIS
jgi:hypothetical protein